jgi:DNA-binding transcriptional LysR family regulator
MDKLAAMRVFVKIADAGNLSAAGRQLGQSLTSVSRQLMALEEFLGTTLVERTTRHLSLTESGLLYYERAKQILEEVAEAERGLTAQTGVASGRLHVSAPSLFGCAWRQCCPDFWRSRARSRSI